MKWMKWWVWAGIILLFLGVIFVLKTGSRTNREAYRTVPVRRGSLKATVASTGRLAPLNTVEVGSQVSGTISSILVDYNSEVKEDQILALIDSSFYAGQADQARAQLEKAKIGRLEANNAIAIAKSTLSSAEAQLFAVRASFQDAERIFTRLNTLAERRIVPGAERDTALTRRDQAIGNVRIAEAQIETAKAQLERALVQKRNASANVTEKQAGLELANIRLDYCTIKSPIDGVVIHRNVDQGQTVAATLQSPLLFMIAEDLKRMQIEIDVSEADVGRIEAGHTVEFNVDAYPNRTFTAVVRQIRNSSTNINNVITYKVVADVDNNELMLRPGMTANVAIVVSYVSDTLIITNAALRYKPESSGTGVSKDREQRPVKEGYLYKTAVAALKLNSSQSDELAQIIENARQKLRSTYDMPEESRDLNVAWHAFFTQVLKELAQILDQKQIAKYKIFRERLIESIKNRSSNNQRRARVYLLREHKPEAADVVIGITDETETQLIGNDLAEGDMVIVGKAFAQNEHRKPSVSLFSRLKP
jgi:HlyD family secretion protein